MAFLKKKLKWSFHHYEITLDHVSQFALTGYQLSLLWYIFATDKTNTERLYLIRTFGWIAGDKVRCAAFGQVQRMTPRSVCGISLCSGLQHRRALQTRDIIKKKVLWNGHSGNTQINHCTKRAERPLGNSKGAATAHTRDTELRTNGKNVRLTRTHTHVCKVF